MKRIRKVLLAGLGCLALTFVVGGCKSKEVTSEYTYDWTYAQEFVDEYDSDMKIDGVIDEARWQDKHWLYHGEDEVKLAYTTAFSEKGVYIAAKVEDDELRWNARFNFSHWRGAGSLNSSFWFLVAGPDVVDGHSMRQFNFFVDAFDRASRNQTRFAAEATTNGDIMAREATEMTVEMFVSWDALNIELGENGEYPEFIYITPTYRYVVENNKACVDNKFISPFGTYPFNTMWWNENGYAATIGDFNYYRAKTGVHFNENGYVNYDAEGAPLGMSANGISKSDGWDVSKLMTDGEVSCVAPYEQFIFISDVYSEKFYVKADIIFNDYVDGNPGDEWPNLGMAIVQSTTNLRAFYMSGKNVLDGVSNADGSWYTHCDSIDLITWKKSSFGKVSAPVGKDVPNEGFTVEMIKDGSIIYYFVEGQLVGTDNIATLSGKACPALFSIGGRGTFKNIVSETDSATIDAKLGEIVSTVTAEATGSGSVELDRYALKMSDGVSTQDVSATIIPDANYTISNITIEGLNIEQSNSWEFFLENYNNGVLKISKEYIVDDVCIKVEFARLRSVLSATEVISLEGVLKDEQGNPLVGSKLVICDEDCKPLYYSIVTSSIGKYSILLPKPGTYEFSGHTFEIDGIYTAKVLGTGGYKSMSYEIDLSQETETKVYQDFILELLEFRPTVIASENYGSSKVEYTIESAYNIKGAYYFVDKSVEQSEDFVLYATINPNNASEVGVMVGTGNGTDGNYLIFALKKGDVGYSAYIWTEGGTETSYNSTSVTFKNEKQWMKVCPYSANCNTALEMALVYKNGEYNMYFNGCLAYTFAETSLMGEGYPKDTYQNLVGTDGSKKLGLVSLNAVSTFIDWGFSTDSTIIQQYIDAEDRPHEVPEIEVVPTLEAVKPKMGAWLYGSGSATAGNEKLSIKGVYLYQGNGIINGTSFASELVLEKSKFSELGFVLTTNNDWAGSISNVMLVYRPAFNDLFLWGSNISYTIAGDINPFKDGDTATMVLIYDNATYYIIVNGVLVCELSETEVFKGGQTMKSVIGTEKMLYLGVAAINDMTHFSNWGYTTNASKIEEYLESVATPDPIVPDGSLKLDYNGFVVGKGGFEYLDDGTIKVTDSTYTFKDVTVAKGSSFAITATIQPTNNQFGFVLTAADGYYLQFVYRANTNDVYLWSDGAKKKWLPVAVNAEVDVFGANNDTATEMTLVYKDGVYYVFFDGKLGCQVSETKDDGGWGNTAVQAIGSGDTIVLGLAARKPNGGDEYAIFSEISYTTDTTEIAKYFDVA